MEETGARKAIASAGIDVGKAELHAHASGEDCSIANTSAGHNALRQWLAERGVQRVVMEPTGRYHRKAHQLLAAGGIEVVLIKPRRSRRFGEAIGEMAKTDRIDAATLAKFGTLFPDLAPARPRDGFGEELEELLIARANLVDVRSKLGHVAGELGGPGEDAIMAVRKFAEKEIARLDTCIAAHIHSDPDYAERYAILRRPPPSPRRPVHGRDVRRHPQSRHEILRGPLEGGRQEAQGGHRRRHAETHHPRECAAPKRTPLATRCPGNRWRELRKNWGKAGRTAATKQTNCPDSGLTRNMDAFASNAPCRTAA